VPKLTPHEKELLRYAWHEAGSEVDDIIPEGDADKLLTLAWHWGYEAGAGVSKGTADPPAEYLGVARSLGVLQQYRDEYASGYTTAQTMRNPAPSAWWLIPAGGAALTAAAAGGLFALTRGDRVVLYDGNLGEAGNVARNHMSGAWHKAAFYSVSDLLSQIESHRRISRLVIIAHGGVDWFYNRGLSPELLGRTVAGRMAWGGEVALAGCSAARNPGAPAVWGTQAFGPGGELSYVGRARDAQRAAGGPLWGYWKGHSLSGHVTGSAAGRIFPFWATGRPGRGVMPVGTDWNSWVDTFTGDPAHEWLTGEAWA
jgi:hypothetical protein